MITVPEHYTDSTPQSDLTDDLFDVLTIWFPQFQAEMFGLAADGPSGRLIVTDDGDELLVGLYVGAESSDQVDGLIIPADATLGEVRTTLAEWLGRTTAKGSN